MKKTIVLFFVLSIFISLKAQDTTSKKIILLPLISNGVDLNSAQTAESILRMELGNQNSLSVVSEKKTLIALDNNECSDEDCAKLIGELLNADEVLLCKISVLGEKIIVQYNLIQTSTGKNIISERATATSVEDLDAVMKRVAISVGNHSPFNTNQEVGNIVNQESLESLRQKARYNFGVGFGYLFPTYGYDTDKKSFTINTYFDYEVKDYSVGLMLGARKGFAINLYGNYLFSKTDVSPYVGGSLGFHWVSSHQEMWIDYSPYPTTAVNKDEDGIEIGLQGGVRLFHTYNFQIFIQGEYIMTFNDYNDKAFVFTIGIL
jgi:TolB-like protein